MPEGKLPPLVGVIAMDLSRFHHGMNEATRTAAAMTSSTSALFGGMATMGTAALIGVSAAAVGLGAVAVHMAGDFQESMTQLVTGAGESKENLGLVSKGILDMAGQVGVSAGDLAKGMYMIESAGYHAGAGLDVLKAAAQGAKVGNADMATVADAVTSALNAYHLQGKDAAAVTNDLIATVASGKMHMQDLAGALGTVLPAASTANVSLKEVTAAIATMTMQGTPAADAATYLRQTILQLENPSQKAQKAMEDVGLSSRQLADDLGKKGLAATLQEATDAISKKFAPGSSEYVAHLADMVGGTKSMQAALELTGGNMPTFQANVKAIGGAVAEGGNQVRGWKDVQEDFNFKIEAGKARLEAFGISIGTRLLPYASTALDWLMAFAPAVQRVAENIARGLVPPIMAAAAEFQRWWPTIQRVAAAFAAQLAPNLRVIQAHAGDLKPVLEATAIVLLGIVGAAAVLIGVTIQMTAAMLQAKDAAMALYNDGMDRLNDALIGTIRMFQAFAAAVGSTWQVVSSGFASGVDFVSGQVDALGSLLGDALGGLAGSAWTWGWNLIAGFARGITAGTGNALDAVRNIAGGIANLIGFHSPAKEGPGRDADKWMPNLVGMLTQGLQSGAAQVQQASGVVAGQMAAPLQAAAGGPSTGVASLSGVEQRLDALVELLGGDRGLSIHLDASEVRDLLERGSVRRIQQAIAT